MRMRLIMKEVYALLVFLFFVFQVSGLVLGESGHHKIHRVQGVTVEVSNLPDKQELIVRIGPFDLPGQSGPTVSRDLFLTIPFDGWIISYEPRVIDGAGRSLPGRLLHHIAFINTARRSVLCEKGQQLIFSTGGEMTTWSVLPNMGYPVENGQRIRILPMFHNRTETTYPETYFEVKVMYKLLTDPPLLTNIYPAWFFIGNCPLARHVQSGLFDLPPSKSVNSSRVTIRFSGKLLWFLGHLHDFGQHVRLENMTRMEEIVTIPSLLDSEGRVRSIPTISFADRGGYHLNRGEVVKLTALYDNPTRETLRKAGMGVIGGYFLPDKEEEFAALKRGSR